MPFIPCDQCGKPVKVSVSRLKRNNHNFCGKPCRDKWLSINVRGKDHPHFGKKRPTSTGKNISAALKGRVLTPKWKDKIGKTLTGKTHTAATKAKMSEQRKGEKHPLFGKPRSEATKEKIRNSLKGQPKSNESNIKRSNAFLGEKNPQWQGGISFGKYCPKFNDQLKERVRKFFNYTCLMCGHKWQLGERKLCVHHINYDKRACCDKNVKPLFAVVCHGKCHNKTNKNRRYWYQHFQELLALQYGGRCFLPKS